MARPREFDPDQALHQAALTFWRNGYEATTTADLLTAMGISRQSLYDTFGDKHALYLQALRHYHALAGADMQERLGSGHSALAAIRAVMMQVAGEQPEQRALGCMGVNAITELSQRDAEVAVLTAANSERSIAMLQGALTIAAEQDEVARGLDRHAAARFLLSVLQGMQVAARNGADDKVLGDIVDMAMRAIEISH